jgi:hypothetical protein
MHRSLAELAAAGAEVPGAALKRARRYSSVDTSAARIDPGQWRGPPIGAIARPV